ncbi:hypothetical protein GCM10022214_72640 [Actinomadura miaoliensis]|uniref:Uncharacterized protein n=1 Tax=Actinomadura miaoliensis TaxID=430685 RepID=A0ABP7WWH5_9ACTN
MVLDRPETRHGSDGASHRLVHAARARQHVRGLPVQDGARLGRAGRGSPEAARSAAARTRSASSVRPASHSARACRARTATAENQSARASSASAARAYADAASSARPCRSYFLARSSNAPVSD